MEYRVPGYQRLDAPHGCVIWKISEVNSGGSHARGEMGVPRVIRSLLNYREYGFNSLGVEAAFLRRTKNSQATMDKIQ
jgi:hypothetical protein